MASTPTPPIVWAFRTLAFASTAAVSWHMIPLLDATPPAHAVLLTKAEEPLFAKAGVNRIARQARRGSRYREQLVEAGVIPALGAVARRGDDDMKEAVGRAVEELVAEEQVALEIIEEENVVGVLMEGKVAIRVWERILEHEKVRGRLKMGGICERITRGGTDEIRGLLAEGGAC